MKKLLSTVLIVCLMLSLCSCSADNDANSGLSSRSSSVLNSASTSSLNIPSESKPVSYNYKAPSDYGVGSHSPSSVAPVFSVSVDISEKDLSDVNEKLTFGFWNYEKSPYKLGKPQDSITVSYPEKELISFITPLTEKDYITMAEVNMRYPIEYCSGEKSAVRHCVYKLNEGGYLYVFYSIIENLFGYWYVVERTAICDEVLTEQNFDSVNKGSTMADVEKIDKGLARMNKIRTDYINAGCIYDEQNKKYSLPGTIHIIDDGYLIILYEDLDNTDGKYIVKNKFVTTSTFSLGITENFFDSDRFWNDLYGGQPVLR